MKMALLVGFFVIGITQVAFGMNCETYDIWNTGEGTNREEALRKGNENCIKSFSVQIKTCEARKGIPYYSTPFFCHYDSTSTGGRPGYWVALYKKDNPVRCCFEQ